MIIIIIIIIIIIMMCPNCTSAVLLQGRPVQRAVVASVRTVRCANLMESRMRKNLM